MKTLIKRGIVSVLCMVSLASCGWLKSDENPDETASIGDLVSDQKSQVNGPNHPDCPSNYIPICAGSGLSYTNACHAEKANEAKWEPGACN